MVKLVALYKKPANQKEFDDNYFNTQLPLANKMPGLRRVELWRVAGTPMGDSEYYLMAELFFDNLDAAKAAMASPEGRAAGKNLMGFAKELVYMMYAEVQEVPATV